MPGTRRKKKPRYKDSTPVRFTVTQTYSIPRRELKKLFDRERAALLSELGEDSPSSKGYCQKIRCLDFTKYLAELESQFSIAVEMGELEPTNDEAILDWADEEFERWTREMYP